jgi:histidinol-phosphatase (PHP family)
MVDCHVHPDFSLDAQGKIEEYCNKAKELGLSGLCFTPHLELDPLRPRDDQVRLSGQIVSMRSGWLDEYEGQVEAARRKFPELFIGLGIEIGYTPGLEDLFRSIVNAHQFDLVLGAIHCLRHISITDDDEYESYFQDRSPKEICEDYFALLKLAIESEIFDVIAHLDVYKKYGVDKERLSDEARPFLGPTLKLMAQKGVGLEINTAGLRKGPGETYPSRAILSQAQAEGIKTITLGSDAHRVEDLGKGLLEAEQLAESLGFNSTSFRRRRPVKFKSKQKGDIP